MDKSLREQLWPLFAEEATERLGVVAEGLVELGRDGSARAPGTLEALRRELHNLKGSAQSVDVNDVAQLAHALEELLAPLGPEDPLQPELLRAGLAATDAMFAALEAVAALSDGTIPALAQLLAGLGRSGEAPPGAGAVEDAPPAFDELTAEASGGAPSAGMTGRTVRVAVASLDRLSERVESLALGQSKGRRNQLLLGSWEEQVDSLVRSAQQLTSASRWTGQHELADQINELGLSLRQLHQQLAREGAASRCDSEQEALTLALVREELRDVRLVPASTLLDPLSRAVRELCAKLGKEATLRLQGRDVRLDRRMVGELRDPILHLLRNALDHGLESPEERTARGKPAGGALEVRVEWRGHRVEITVSDDGSGFSLERVKEEGIRRGLITAETAATLTEREIQILAFHPGLSTAKSVTETSGRGIGLNAVRDVARRLGGEVHLSSRAGLGTSFLLDLPLTLAATLGVRVRVGDDQLIIPLDAVERMLRIDLATKGTVAGRSMVQVDEAQLPYAELGVVLRLQAPEQGAGEERDHLKSALVLNVSGRRAVLGVDEIEGQFEVVLQPLAGLLGEAEHLAGAAVLDDGSVLGVANPSMLLDALGRDETRSELEKEQPQILVVDDSFTTRTTVKTLLEMAGYSVVTANDGEEGLRLLARSPCALVVTDVEMPRLNGIELARRIKATPALSRTKVVVISSLDAESDRSAGLDAGADGYLVKQELHRGDLIDLVRQLLPGGA